MSKHPVDRLALLVGVPVLLAGLAGFADSSGIVHPGGWIVVLVMLAIGILGIAFSVVALRDTTEEATSPDN